MPVNKKNNTKKNHHANKKNKNYRAEKPIVKKEIHEITYSDGMTVGELADKIGKQASDIIKALFLEGKMVTINSALDDEMVQLVCIGYDIDATKVKEKDEFSLEDEEEDGMLTMVKQLYWMRFAVRKWRLVKRVVSLKPLGRIKSKLMNVR